jgi:GNAT superfamily N-acetyltransferase
MTVTFQLAQKDDLAVLLPFMQALFESDNPPTDQPFDEPAARQAVLDLLKKPDFGRVWLIMSDGQPAGYVVLTIGYSLEYQGHDAFIDELFLTEPYRGQGIGQQAIVLVEETCRELGVNALHLEVERPNLRAQMLYRRVGFEDHDRYLMTKWLK